MNTESRVPHSTTGFGLGAQLLAFADLLLISNWLGSMIFFSFAVAPSAFAVLPTRELAGVMVTSAIGKVEMLGLIIGPLLILIRVARWRAEDSGHIARLIQLLLLCVMIAAAALSRFWISPRMVSLRTEMGGRIDDLPVTDPLRVHFNDLHQYSVALMSAAIIAGLLVLFLRVRSWVRYS
ncbi:MAG TPA: DUF4149 domain-containing protein [Blastocatellia bacterium]|nr:DUF4149 domain-containing protein [Blastocatellia bacterium]